MCDIFGPATEQDILFLTSDNISYIPCFDWDCDLYHKLKAKTPYMFNRISDIIHAGKYMRGEIESL